MIPYLYTAKLVKIIDGDTFDAEVDLGFRIKTKLRFHLANVNTPETWRPTTEEERAHGNRAKTFVEDLLAHNHLFIKPKKTGIYNNWRVEVYFNYEDAIKEENSLSSRIIEAGLEKDPALYKKT